jgi:hypothetical protein
MRTKFVAIPVACLMALALAGPAGAVTNGQPDGNNHPYVGLLVFDTLVEGVPTPTWRCSGALLSPTVVLTAAHCTDGAVAARAWFQSDVTYNVVPFPLYPYGGAGSGAYEGTPYVFPGYASLFAHGLVGFSFGDVGIVVLSQAVPTSQVSRYAQLPTAGLVDTMANKSALDYVGFGVQIQVKSPGVVPFDRWAGPRVRNYAPGGLIAANFQGSDNTIKVTMNAAAGKGGTCFGDSGGPDLIGGTDTVIAVNSFVTNANCSGVGYDTRVDVPARLAWIHTFLDTPSACTFAAPDSLYYNGPTSSAPLYGTGPMSFTWVVTTGTVTAGHWDELASGVTYLNVVQSGTYTNGQVTLAFVRTVPNAYAFPADGTLTGGSFVGTADGPYLWTATGSVTCH